MEKFYRELFKRITSNSKTILPISKPLKKSKKGREVSGGNVKVDYRLPHKITVGRSRYKVNDDIKNKEDDALSNFDLEKLLGNKAKILVYEDLKNYSDLDEVLEPEGSVIILYQDKKNQGHWVALLRRKNGIEFFDSYGGQPDTQLASMKYNKLPYLLNLIENYPGVVYYNPYQLQSDDRNVSTCGRWCALRILLKELSLNDFAKIFTGKGKDPDYIATLLTKYI